MNQETIQSLRTWAEQYNTKAFIKDDPVQFPHRFTDKRDIEVSAFLTAWITYGRRDVIVKKAEELHRMLGEHPFEFIKGGMFDELQKRGQQTFYRFYTYADLLALCQRLHQIYAGHETLEDALRAVPAEAPVRKLQQLFASVKGIPVLNGTSACKRLAMFLRWMVRRDGIVDFGIWPSMSPSDLVIPLDTHVFQISRKLELTGRSTATWNTAVEITEQLKHIFPDDPCLGDFALFGYDMAHSRPQLT